MWQFVMLIWKNIIQKLYNIYKSGDIINKDLMLVCDEDNEKSLLSKIMMKMNTRDDKERYALELIRSIKIKKLQAEKEEIEKKNNL